MSFRIVRASKFRHVFSQTHKKENCYDNIRITKNSWDSPFCVVNPKFLAIITEPAGGGAFLVLPLSKTGRLDVNQPLVTGHKGAVLDIAWNPFNDNLIASTSEDLVIRLWSIPDNGLTKNLTEPVLELTGHQRRCGFLLWHPTAENVLLSAGTDFKILIWNVGNASIITSIELPDLIFHCSFNYDGSKLCVTCKDKKIHIIDPRTGEEICEGNGHEGAKPQKAIYLKNGKIFTTGFSRMSERQYSLRSEDNLDEPIVLEVVDTSNGVLFPFYDSDTNLLYLCAKGDCTIKYYEITDEQPYVHYINTYQSSEPQRGIGQMPKRGCDIKNCEIGRFFKLHSKGLCEVISFTVPRKSDLFQEDIYPDTAAPIPALSAEEWASGIDRDPILISLKDGSISSSNQFKKPESKTNNHNAANNGLNNNSKKPQPLDKNKMTNSVNNKIASFQEKFSMESPPVTPASNSSNNIHTFGSHSNGNNITSTPNGNPNSSTQQPKLTDLLEELKIVKSVIIKHETRIRDLEKKLIDQKGTNNYTKSKGYHENISTFFTR